MGGSCSKQLDTSPVVETTVNGLTLQNGTILRRSDHETHNERLHAHGGMPWILGTDDCMMGRRMTIFIASSIFSVIACSGSIMLSGLPGLLAVPLYILVSIAVPVLLAKFAAGSVFFGNGLKSIGLLPDVPTLADYYYVPDDGDGPMDWRLKNDRMTTWSSKRRFKKKMDKKIALI